MLLEDEGDFLVRESKSKAGQYVLSGVQRGQPRHLLLVDPEGKVCVLFFATFFFGNGSLCKSLDSDSQAVKPRLKVPTLLSQKMLYNSVRTFSRCTPAKRSNIVVQHV